ncbi:MAG: hypothetical protein PHX78_00915 [bacterium]|nr:hypothetical protein [bacterium]
MVKISEKVLFIFLFFVFIWGCSNKNRPTVSKVNIEGKWKSQSPEKAGESAFVERQFRFLDKLWQIDYTLYQDKELQKPVFQFQGEGSYGIEGPSSKVKGAFNGNFTVVKKYITLLTDDKEAVKNYGFDIYKFEKGKKMDISESGCYFITPVNECDKEYDIIKTDGSVLYFGKRPADNNISKPEKRPTELGLPLVKY